MSSKSAISLAVAIVLMLANCMCATAANPFIYAIPTDAHSGTFSGELPLDKIGTMILPRGVASFSGDVLTIRAVPQWLFDRNVVLRGAIVRAEAAQQQNSFALGGLVVMLEGMWLSNLDRGNKTESIDTMSGVTLRGRIVGRTQDALVFKKNDGNTENVLFLQIKSINSARAFTFNLNTDGVKLVPGDSSMSFNATQLVMQPSRKRAVLLAYDHIPRSTLSGTEAGISKTALATFVTLDMFSMLAPPIAIPLVLNAKNQRAAKNRIAEAEFQNFTNAVFSNSSSNSNSSSQSASSGSGM